LLFLPHTAIQPNDTTSMVIMNYKGGRLANRIYLFGHFIANAIEHQYALYNPEFDEYCPYFEATANNRFDNHRISIRIFKFHLADRIFSRLFRLWADITHRFFTTTPFYVLYRIFKTNDRHNVNFVLTDAAYLANAQTKTVITEGWVFRDHENFLKHSDDIRRYFTPVKQYRDEVAALMSTIRPAADVIVGVHIRRGDYTRYNNGNWYYNNAVYAEKMLQVQAQINATGKSCAFLICSNETVDITSYPASLHLFTGNRHFMVDLYGLAACDAIIGPPSTYSQWASFYGKVPLSFIFSKEEVMQIKPYQHAENP
jgi:hypothetical protein